MLTNPNFKMTFIFAIVSNIGITTLKFINIVGAKQKHRQTNVINISST